MVNSYLDIGLNTNERRSRRGNQSCDSFVTHNSTSFSVFFRMAFCKDKLHLLSTTFPCPFIPTTCPCHWQKSVFSWPRQPCSYNLKWGFDLECHTKLLTLLYIIIASAIALVLLSSADDNKTKKHLASRKYPKKNNQIHFQEKQSLLQGT